jgi:hypothetical protein
MLALRGTIYQVNTIIQFIRSKISDETTVLSVMLYNDAGSGSPCSLPIVKLEKDVSLYGYEMLRIIYTWQRQAPLGNHTMRNLLYQRFEIR